MEPDSVMKKRGRKPKIFLNESVDLIKKKRGRKKKYEIENFDKIINRNDIDNFDHKIVYSDDEKNFNKCNSTVKKISFGNLNITVSKQNILENNNYRNILIQKTKNNSKIINDESSDSDYDELIINNQDNQDNQNNKNNIHENIYQNNQNNIIKDCNKNIKCINTLKNIIKDNTFPEKTNIYCWWCVHPFECSPCTLPIKYNNYTNKFKVVGIFCSWNCVKSYNFEIKDQYVSERCSLITMLIQRMYNLFYAISIKAAPPRQSLKVFGGYLNIDDFRNNNRGVESYKLNILNNNFIYPEIIELSKFNRKK